MTRAERLHERDRVIARRMRIVRQRGGEIAHSGRLAKWNLTCGCWACKRPRYTRRGAQDRSGATAFVMTDGGASHYPGS